MTQQQLLTTIQQCTDALNNGKTVIDKEGVAWIRLHGKYCAFAYHKRGDVYRAADINNIALPAAFVELLSSSNKKPGLLFIYNSRSNT